MNDLLIKALITVMIIDAGMHFYYDYKKNTYQSLKFLILTVLMAVSVRRRWQQPQKQITCSNE